MKTTLLAFALLLAPALRADDAPKLAPTPLETRTAKLPHTTATYDLVKIPGGTVELDGKKVVIPPLWVGRTEVTWDWYDVYALALDLPEQQRPYVRAKPADGGSRPTHPNGPADRGYGHESHPALGISYEASVKYCKWLSDITGHKYRLPTEAESILIAQAGSGKDPADIDAVAWHKGNSGEKTHPIATKSANAWGLYDVYGNVAEWVQKPDPAALDKFVLGGSFRDRAKGINARTRDVQNPGWQQRDCQDPQSTWWLSDGDFAGFRLICEDDPAPRK